MIESNFVFFEGNGFFLRESGSGALTGLTWGQFLTCNGLGAGIGVDCWGAAQPAVRYDSPTWGGFSFKASYGANRLTGPFALADDSDFADVAAFYANDWGNWKVSAAYAYTWIETAVTTGNEADLHQVGGTIMHTPTGLGVYGMGQWEDTSGAPDTQAYGVKPFWKASISPLGATVFYGEWARYEDQFGGLVGDDLCGGGGCFVLGSEVERYGLGVVQEIDAAAMHVFARWQHQELDVDITNTNVDFEDWDLFQAGGIIFF